MLTDNEDPFKHWDIVEIGSAFSEIEKIQLIEAVTIEFIRNRGSIDKNCQNISERIEIFTGKGKWQVLFIQGNFGNKFFCSGKNFLHIVNNNGFHGFIWLNKFVNYL